MIGFDAAAFRRGFWRGALAGVVAGLILALLLAPFYAESLLADEVQRITGNVAENARGGVWVEGDECTAMQLNLESRLAQRVLWPLVKGLFESTTWPKAAAMSSR